MITEDPKILAVLANMREMTPQQKDFFVRVVERVAEDDAFVIRLQREQPIFNALFRAEHFDALERWFGRKTLEVVK